MHLILWVSCIVSGFISSSMGHDVPIYDIERAEQLFEEFIIIYDKTYLSQQEKQTRLEIFTENLKNINRKNAKGGAVYDIHRFADWTVEEFAQKFMGYSPPFEYNDHCTTKTDNDISTNNAPETLNWVSNGAVTPVKNQKQCGSCWTFSTTGNIEGQYFIKHGSLVSFSEQQLVDCSKRNHACEGGFMSDAMTDIQEMGGLQTEEDYPYKQVNKEKYECMFDASKVVAKLAGCTRYSLNDEDKLKEELAKRGPMSIVVFANSLFDYKGGILTAADCVAEGLHAVLLVGYGTEAGKDYWLVKNSWGSEFGEQGYFRLSRHENTCGMMTSETASADLM